MLMIRRAIRTSSALACALLAVTATAPGASAQSEPVVIASGLNSPRHLAFSPNGDLYVVEAGRGGPRPGDPGTPNCEEHPLGLFCLGTTGSVTLVREHGPDERVLTGLPSISNGAEPVGPEALGPSDITFTGNQKFVLSIGLGGSDTFRAGFGADGALLATLVTGKLKQGGWSLFADVLANEATANPDGTDIDSNPVGIARDGEGYVVADAGGNARRSRIAQGNVHDGHVVAPRKRARSPVPRPATGTQIPTDAVPTSVVQGPDGAYYLTQLTGFPFEKGDANIWRVIPGQAPTVYASGLTNLTDLAFADDGSLYAVQISVEGLLNGPIGALVKINPGSAQHETIAGGPLRALRSRTSGRLRLRQHLHGVRWRGRGRQDLTQLIRPTEPFARAGHHAPVAELMTPAEIGPSVTIPQAPGRRYPRTPVPSSSRLTLWKRGARPIRRRQEPLTR